MAFSLTALRRTVAEPSFRRIVATLLLIDVLLLLAPIVAGGLVYLGLLEAVPQQLKLQPVWSLPSLFIYLKWLLIAACLATAWRKSDEPLLLSLAIIFGLLLIDDSLELHEQLGTATKDWLGYGPAFGLRGDDLGELTIWAILGAVCCAVFALGYRRSSLAGRGIGHVFLLGIAALAACGIVVDMLSIMAHDFGDGTVNRATRFLFRCVEDGGELMIASLLLAFALVTLRDHAPTTAVV